MEKPSDMPDTKPRSSAYVDGVNFSDDGCSLAPSCLECPFPVCRYDVHGIPGIKAEIKKEFIRKAKRMGYKRSDIAKEFGISLRVIHRA